MISDSALSECQCETDSSCWFGLLSRPGLIPRQFNSRLSNSCKPKAATDLHSGKTSTSFIRRVSSFTYIARKKRSDPISQTNGTDDTSTLVGSQSRFNKEIITRTYTPNQIEPEQAGQNYRACGREAPWSGRLSMEPSGPRQCRTPRHRFHSIKTISKSTNQFYRPAKEDLNQFAGNIISCFFKVA